jgi:GMP synthase-like glutamine amidotransferase
MKIGILQTGHSPEGLIAEYGDYGQMFTHLLNGQGLSFEIFSVVDGEFPPSIHVADGWLITGSRFGAYEDHDWIPPLEDFLRAAFVANLPIVGICFGHQILAQALGGKVEKYQGGWAVGATEYLMNGQTLTLNAWHQDQVVKRPNGARVLASAPECENAILAYGDTALSFQPHPEFDSGFVQGLANGRGKGVVPDALLNQALARLDMPVARSKAVDMITGFFANARDMRPAAKECLG